MGLLIAAMWTAERYTDTGQKRALNQDAVFSCNGQLLWGVADGMGGHESGDYASQLVTERLADYRHAPLPGISMRQLRTLMADCNRELVEKARREQVDVIGCTVALLSFHGAQLTCSWSGDSRIYRLRDRRLFQLTRDHSYQSAVEDRDIQRFPMMTMSQNETLTSAIGGEETLHLEHCLFTLNVDDQFLLCTDGLYKELSDDDIRGVFASECDAARVVKRLSAMYHERGARDNIGMVLVHHASDEPAGSSKPCDPV